MTQYLVNVCLMMIWKGIIILLFAAVVNNILQSIIHLLHIMQNDSEKMGYLFELKTISVANNILQSIIHLLHIKQNDSEKIGYLSELKTMYFAISLFLHFGKHAHCPS